MDNEKVVQLLEEILKWTRFQGMLKVKEVLQDVLKTDEEKLSYHYSDGKGSREVAALAGLKAHTTVVDLWKKWAILGIVEPIRVQRGIRYKRSFSLSDFGIEVPKAKAEAEKVEIKEEPEAVEKEQKGEEQ